MVQISVGRIGRKYKFKLHMLNHKRITSKSIKMVRRELRQHLIELWELYN